MVVEFMLYPLIMGLFIIAYKFRGKSEFPALILLIVIVMLLAVTEL